MTGATATVVALTGHRKLHVAAAALCALSIRMQQPPRQVTGCLCVVGIPLQRHSPQRARSDAPLRYLRHSA